MSKRFAVSIKEKRQEPRIYKIVAKDKLEAYTWGEKSAVSGEVVEVLGEVTDEQEPNAKVARTS